MNCIDFTLICFRGFSVTKISSKTDKTFPKLRDIRLGDLGVALRKVSEQR